MNSNDDNMKIVKLKSLDGKLFEIEENCLERAKFFKEIKDIMNLNEEVKVDVSSKILEKIIEYLKHYVNEEPNVIPKPIPNDDLKQFLNEWDFNYITSLSLEETIDMINAANYMNIKELVDLCSARVAWEMINCPIHDARRKFGILEDMTEEEVQQYDKYPKD